jgi:cell division protein FtsI/penicillin-binding protein 2
MINFSVKKVMSNKTYDKIIEFRIKLYFIIILCGAILILGRYFYLQVIDHQKLLASANAEHTFDKILKPQRGEIFIKDKFGEKYAVAINKQLFTLYAIPAQIKDKKSTAKFLADILKIDQAELYNKLNSNSKSAYLVAKNINMDTISTILNKKIDGVYDEENDVREYPLKNILAQTIGFVGFDENDNRVGRYGLEKYYNDILEGQEGKFVGEKTNEGTWLPFGKQEINAVKDGADLTLTIDYSIQIKSQQVLEETIKKWNAESGVVIVMDPNDGKILALAGYPSYDPNNFNQVKDFSLFLNGATQVGFEPGSIFKPFTMAMGLDLGLVTPDTQYEDTGALKFGGYTIKNYDGKAHGTQTMTGVLEKSLNTGAVFVEQKVGMDNFLKYTSIFKLNEKTGIDMLETNGSLANLNDRRDINFATASFGQGVRLTPIEIIRGFSAIANGGFLIQPHLLDTIKHSTGVEEKTVWPKPQRILKDSTAHDLSAMLVNVVEHGFDKAKIEGYSIAGKTGTAQIPDSNGRGYLPPDQMIHSFVGFAPAYDPKFLILMKIVRPKGINFASNSLTPYFRELTNFILQYMQIPPDRPVTSPSPSLTNAN